MIRRDNCDGLLGVAKRVLILEAVARTSTRREAARLLGMNQGSLSTYLRQYGFAPYERPEGASSADRCVLSEFLWGRTWPGFDPIELGC